MMINKTTFLFGIFAVIALGSLIVIISTVAGGVSVAEAQVGTETIIVQLEDSIAISDEIEVSLNG